MRCGLHIHCISVARFFTPKHATPGYVSLAALRDKEKKRLRNHNAPVIPAQVLNRNLPVALFRKPFKLFSPFNQQNAVGRDQVVERQSIKFARSIDAVKINVVKRHLRTAIFVDESECRAGYILSECRVKSFGNAFDENGLPRSQIAAQENDSSRLDIVGEPAAEISGFLG